jgi:hypothetical protein
MVEEVKFNKGDLVVISANHNGHKFPIGTECKIYRVLILDGNPVYDVCHYPTGDCWTVSENEITLVTKTQTSMTQVQKAVLDTANALLKANNTVTTLEVKTKLRKDFPEYYWTQEIVSSYMSFLSQEGHFNWTDNGTYRIYSSTSAKVYPTVNKVALPKATKTKTVTKALGKAKAIKTVPVAIPNKAADSKISRKKALELMQNNKGRFFTATFIKKDKNGKAGEERTINCQYIKDQGDIPSNHGQLIAMLRIILISLAIRGTRNSNNLPKFMSELNKIK